MFFLVGGELVLGEALVVTALDACQAHDVSGHVGQSFGHAEGVGDGISLSDEHVLQFEAGAFEGVQCLCGLVCEAELVEFGKFLPSAHVVAVLHVDVRHDAGAFEAQVGHASGGDLAGAHQFMAEGLAMEGGDGDFVPFGRQQGGDARIGRLFPLRTGAGRQQEQRQGEEETVVLYFHHRVCFSFYGWSVQM